MPSPRKFTGLPGIFFIYKFNPFMIEKVAKPIPLSHFVAQVCAILGGVFTTASIVDDLFYKGARTFLRRSD